MEDIDISSLSDSELTNMITDNENEIRILDARQMAIKICINSLYGCLGTPSFRFYDARMAEAVTLTGQLITKSAEKCINERIEACCGQKTTVYYGDTDSVGCDLQGVVDKYLSGKTDDQIYYALEKFGNERIEPVLNKCFRDLSDKLNCSVNKIFFKPEQIAKRAIHTAKKRYVQLVLGSEGVKYNEPKLKIMGLEAVRSSTPAIIRDWIKETMHMMLIENEETVQKFLMDKYEQFKKLRIEDIAFPKPANNLEKYIDNKRMYKSGTPIHVRATILHNHYISNYNLVDKYDYIRSGDSIKYIYLKMPNPIKENVIAFDMVLPPEFGLHQYIDYELMWDKTFLNPITALLDAAGWTAEPTVDITDIFGW